MRRGRWLRNGLTFAHYHLRSFEEYIWKFSRGGNDGKGVVKNKHFRYNSPAIFDLFAQTFAFEGTSTASRLTKEAPAEIHHLTNIPGVAEAMQDSIFRYCADSEIFVEESLQSMLADNRIDENTKKSWEKLCSVWREKREPKNKTIFDYEIDIEIRKRNIGACREI